MTNTRTFKVKTASSMFMHGAENRQQAEIRPPAVRGVMRYWFRAIAGRHMDLSDLRNAEAEVFGSADVNVGQRLLVRMSPQINGLRKFPLLPHKSGRDASDSPAIEPGREITIRLSAVGKTDSLKEDQRLDLASWGLWLAIHLGGFGQRARRGAGSLHLIDIQPPLIAGALQASASPQGMKDLLEAGLKKGIECVRRSFPKANRDGSQAVSFPVLATGKAQIVVGMLRTANEQEARKKVMELRESVDQTHRDQAFGGIGPRFSSPLHVHLEPHDQQSFIIVATWFREPARGKAPLVEEFLKKIKNTQGLEVTIP
jgi:CRISPR-associated protein Cmr1